MIAWIKQWAEGIVIAVIIATILEMLLPNNKNKKYINTVIGVYILFTIISPIITKITGKSVNIADYVNNNTALSTNYTINNVALLENSSDVEDIYIKTLKTDITNKLELKGYSVNFINIDININSGSNYGEILGISLNVSSAKEENSINNIEEVKVNLSDENSKNVKNDMSEGELNNIKEFLQDTYGIEKNKIHINK